MGRLNVLQAYTDPMQMCTITAPTGMNQRFTVEVLEAKTGEGCVAAILLRTLYSNRENLTGKLKASVCNRIVTFVGRALAASIPKRGFSRWWGGGFSNRRKN
jgi:hypothetical protein